MSFSFLSGARASVDAVDDDLRQELFDPAGAQRLVLARRSANSSAVTDVVSDVVWHEVVRLLRWSTATTRSAAVDAARWWRLAAACADLLRRLPALCDELGEPWNRTVPPDDVELPGTDRVAGAAGRLTALLRAPDPVPLRRLAGDVDALGAAAISALAQTSSWALPGTPRTAATTPPPAGRRSRPEPRRPAPRRA